MQKISTNPFGPEGWTPARLDSLSGKTYLITGANVGAGFEATKVLVSKGGKVVMLCRNPGKTKAAVDEVRREFPDADVSYIELDLASMHSVRRGLSLFSKTYSR